MHLKTLKLVGFKSFADRTRLEFRSGVTVIVGPNGSGKSNIVDAVAWVMGTQSAKSLRTDKMDDVIFAGTATRPGLGRAEVTLVFDNTGGVLPLDVAEVAITRRLYRDGSSDYEINGVTCRLLDVQELLSDSHVGRHQHVIIGQGQIDSVLNADPDDHRAVIEEAAGILKHRIRKDKAIRRLERTDVDVVRLRDIVAELARQMKPLRRQAEAATHHHEVAGDVRSLRLYLGGEELRRILGRQAEIAQLDSLAKHEIEELERSLAELEGERSTLRLAAGEVGEALERDTIASARLETTIERLLRIGQVAKERHRSGSARLEGADERRRDLDAESAELADGVALLKLERYEAERAVEEGERRFRQAEDEERSFADQEGMSTEGAIAVVRGDLRSIDSADERDEREREAIARRIQVITAQLESEIDQVTQLKDEIKQIDGQAGVAQVKYADAETRRKGLQTEWERADSDRHQGQLDLAASRARVEAIEAAVAGLADPDARRLLEAATGALGSLARRLDVPTDLGAAIDAALGPWTDAVVFDAGSNAGRAVTTLKGDGRGGVPVVYPGHGVGADVIAEAEAAAKAWGIDTLVDRLGSSADRVLADRLLGDVLLVEGWSAAWSIVAKYPRLRITTPEGDLITAMGARIAHPQGATPAMLEAAIGSMEAADLAFSRVASLYTTAKRAFDEARTTERSCLEDLERHEAQLAGTTEALGRAERLVISLGEERLRLEERNRSIQGALAERYDRRRSLTSRLGALEGEEAERQRVWEELSGRRHQASVAREVARAAWQEAESMRRGIVERLTMVESRQGEIERLLDAENRSPVDPENLRRLLLIADRSRQALEACRVHLETLRRRQARLRGEVGITGTRLGEVEQMIEESRRVIGLARDRLSANAVESAGLSVRAEAVGEALRRDLDTSEEVALAAPKPDFASVDLAALLATREAELRRMGPVNPLAAEEYAELESRHGFLSTQLDDLEKSRNELRKVIEALDDEIQTQFMSAYAEIAEGFEEHFSILFPGGAGRLCLTDPDNPLASGVEIEAQPLGKKVAKMSLLSGGERSLAALAFMFSVFKARPSPFYILDEVEAALDDANLRRFLRMLERFRVDAQLLVITHQQQTMETADILYGVTMEPGGSSKVVAKRMTDIRREFPVSAS